MGDKRGTHHGTILASSALQSTALDALDREDAATAGVAIRCMLALSEAFSRHPLPTMQLVRCNVLEQAFATLVPDRLDLDPEEWTALADAFEKPRLQEDFVRGLEFHRAGVLQAFSEGGCLDDERGFEGACTRDLFPLVQPYFRKTSMPFLAKMKRTIELSRQPFFVVREELSRLFPPGSLG